MSIRQVFDIVVGQIEGRPIGNPSIGKRYKHCPALTSRWQSKAPASPGIGSEVYFYQVENRNDFIMPGAGRGHKVGQNSDSVISGWCGSAGQIWKFVLRCRSQAPALRSGSGMDCPSVRLGVGRVDGLSIHPTMPPPLPNKGSVTSVPPPCPRATTRLADPSIARAQGPDCRRRSPSQLTTVGHQTGTPQEHAGRFSIW